MGKESYLVGKRPAWLIDKWKKREEDGEGIEKELTTNEDPYVLSESSYDSGGDDDYDLESSSDGEEHLLPKTYEDGKDNERSADKKKMTSSSLIAEIETGSCVIVVSLKA